MKINRQSPIDNLQREHRGITCQPVAVIIALLFAVAIVHGARAEGVSLVGQDSTNVNSQVEVVKSAASAVKEASVSVVTSAETEEICQPLKVAFNAGLSKVQCQKIIVSAIAEWSPALKTSVKSVLETRYNHLRELVGQEWVENLLKEWEQAYAKIAVLEWQLITETETNSITSLAVIQPDGGLLYDSVMASVPLSVRTEKIYHPETGARASAAAAVLAPTDSDWVETIIHVTTLLGAANYHYRIDVSAEVSPYVAPVTNDGQLSGTVDVNCWVTDISGIAPGGSPVVYLGTGGTVGNANSPFVSPVSVSQSADHFQNGLYTAVVTEGGGNPWSVSFSVSYGAGGISISPPTDTTCPVVLTPGSTDGRKINIADKIYSDFWAGKYRGVFWDGGGVTLQNFIIRAGDGGAEKGSCSLAIPMQCGHAWWDVSPFLDSFGAGGTASVQVEYVRGNRIPDPNVTVTSSSYSMNVGQQTTLQVTVNNPSQVVSMDSGQVSVDTGSLGPLIVLGSATQNLGTIAANSSKQFTFTLLGNSTGVARPQVSVTGRWGWPAGDAGKTFSRAGTCDANITVFQPTATVTVQANPSNGGTVSGGGTYDVGAQVQIYAFPKSGWTYTGWSDGNTQSPRTITVPSGGATYTANFQQQTGSLQVTISPAGAINAGALWQVDGGAWQSSGAGVSGLSVGNHTVHFSTIGGWTSPSDQTVTVNSGSTTTTSGTYVQQTGSLQVTILPAGAISAGAQWQVDGGAWQNSGATVSGLSVGSHTVAFKGVSGYNTPGNQIVAINNGLTTTATGTYTTVATSGSLQVTITPSAAVGAGAQWQVDGGAWQGSGAIVSGLSVGTHAVHFSTISGWSSPADQTVSISDGSTTTATGTYVPLTQSGSLQVTILPAGAVSAGAQWQVDGGAWQNSGATVSGLSVGSHTVAFKGVSGYSTPGNQVVTINNGLTTTATGTYTPLTASGSLQVTITPSAAVSAGAQWQVDGGAWQGSGAVVSGLGVGSHAVHFSTISGWSSPADQTVSISNGSTTPTTGTYVLLTQSGSLLVTITPAGAVSAGAQWQVDGGAWQNSGATVSGLSVSSHAVAFKTITDWNTPNNQSVSISNGGTTTVNGTYSPVNPGSELIIDSLTVSNVFARVSNKVIVVAGDVLGFNMTAHDTGGHPLNYRWNFGDGTSSAWSSLSTATHVYTQSVDCGLYVASAIVTNGLTATTSNFTVAVACQLNIAKLQAKLNFAKANTDNCSLKTTLDLGASFNPAGKTMTLDLGDAQVSFTLDSKGRGVADHGTCRLTYNKKTGTWTLTAKLRGGDWQTSWAAYGLVEDDVAPLGVPVKFPVVVVMGDDSFAVEKTLVYKAKPGKSGNARLVP